MDTSDTSTEPGDNPVMLHQPRLSHALLSAATKADAEADAAIAANDPEWAEAALRRAAQFRRLATNHQAKALLSGDADDDPVQVLTAAPSQISPDEIRIMREALRLKPDQLADALDVTEMTVRRWESGQSRVAHPRMLRLALWQLGERVN